MGGQGKGPSGTFYQDLRILRVLFWPNVALVGFFWCPQSKISEAGLVFMFSSSDLLPTASDLTIYLHILNCPVAQAEWNVPEEAT